ncbi:MAG: acyl transferase [Bacteroidota bacterium]|jgi:hypothetical protein
MPENLPLRLIQTDEDFNAEALALFYWQLEHVEVYKRFFEYAGRSAEKILTWKDIPALPVSAFKTHRVLAQGLQAKITFSSSTTSGTEPSLHHLPMVELYNESFLEGFCRVYGDPHDYCILALLPSYLERSGSSLVHMTDVLIRRSADRRSGFFLDQWDELHRILVALRTENRKTILLGVTFALLDFAQQYPIDFPELIVMETGGMKGRRKEMVRQEVHAELMKAFEIPSVHAEYGMTELLSQAYALKEGLFVTPPWMKIRIMDATDPFAELEPGRSGRIVIADLANRFSCAFVATDDIGRMHPDGTFEVLGRMDHSDVRGCNLMVF